MTFKPSPNDISPKKSKKKKLISKQIVHMEFSFVPRHNLYSCEKTAKYITTMIMIYLKIVV